MQPQNFLRFELGEGALGGLQLLTIPPEHLSKVSRPPHIDPILFTLQEGPREVIFIKMANARQGSYLTGSLIQSIP